MSSSLATPAPPIPRRHPSRPSLKSTPSDASSTSGPAPALSAPGLTRRPTSMFLDDPGKMASGSTIGFTGRVGLGSPRLEFFPNRREENSDVSDVAVPAVEEEEGEETSRPGSYIDRQSGLPSPPGTESDVGPPPMEDIHPDKPEAPTRPRLQPRLPSTSSSIISPHRRTPSNTSAPSRRRIQPKSQGSTTTSRSASSSSSIHTLSMSTSRPSDPQQGASRTPSPQKPSPGQGHGRSPSLPSSSLTDKLSRHSSRRSSGVFSATIGEEETGGGGGGGGGTIKRTHSGSIYPQIGLPNAAKPTHSRRSSRRSSAIYSPAAIASSSESEAAANMKRRTSGDGDDLDNRIRQAEEKIKNVRTRSSRPSTSPTKPAIRRHDSYSRQTSPSVRDTATSAGANTGTLRRSATLSSASASVKGSPWIGDHSPEKNDTVGRREIGEFEGTERDRSGGSSGSGKRKPLPTEFRQTSLFTPSPKHATHPTQLPSSSRFSRTSQLAESPEERISGLPPSSHFISPSRRFDTLDSPSTRFLRHEGIEGLDRSPSSSIRTRDRRQWSESLSGLPSPRTDMRLDHRETPMTRRAESVMDGHTPDRNRYQSRSSTLSSSSRLALTPGDSVSVVGSGGRHTATTDSGKKDPLEVLNRIEQSRELHNRQWEEDRAASVLGEFDSSPRRAYRPGSANRDDRTTILPLRPATSMSSMRESYDRDAPRSAPIHRLHQRAFHDAQLESPSGARRGPSRLSHGPISEPRPMRSSTSLAVRAGTALDAYVAHTEHGRLLLEAFRALELKLPDQLNGVPDLVRALQSTILAQETINTSVRESLHIGSNMQIALDLGDPDLRQLKKDTERLNSLLRETNRASDQSIRDLTRVLLDLPKLLRESSRLTTATSHTSLRNNTPSPASASASAQNGIRRSGSIMSRTSLDSVRSPEDYSTRYGRNGQNGSISPLATLSRERRSLEVGRSGSSMANFVSRFKGSPKKDSGGSMSLPPINQSPPGESRSAFESDNRYLGSSSSNSSLDRSGRYSMDEELRRDGTFDSPKSPERLRNMLKKKSSSISTHTIKGSPTTTLQQPAQASSTPFFPSPVRRTTTAISQITVGLDTSPPHGDHASVGGVNRSKSIKSIRSIRTLPDSGTAETAGGEFSIGRGYHGRRVSSASTSDSLAEGGYDGIGEGEGEVDAVGLLAAAAQQREERNGAGEEAGKGKMSGRWKNGWRRSK